MTRAKDAPDPVDVTVGHRIRNRRKELGFTQSALATGLGITFQQVQKYERGSNRVSASMLWHTARFLQVPISYFFDGLAARDDLSSAVPSDQLLRSQEGAALATAYFRIPDGLVRQAVLQLVQQIASFTAKP